MSELISLAGLREIRVNGQQTLPSGHIFPFAATGLSTAVGFSQYLELSSGWAKTGALQRTLDKHGAILLRGLPVTSPEEFSQLLHTFGWTPHLDVGNPVKRKGVAPAVAKANEGPPSLYIAAHSEFGISNIFPSHICFWGSVVADKGGETPLNSSSWLYERLSAEIPEFVKDLQEKGVTYTIFHPAEALSGDANGNGVLNAWGAQIVLSDTPDAKKAKIEAEIQRISPETTWEWKEDGSLFTFQRVPAFRKHPTTGSVGVFGNISSYYWGSVKMGTVEPPHLTSTGFYKPPPRYGDDSLIPVKYLDKLMSIIEETRSSIKWEKYDVLIIDNLSTQHARLPWTKGNREILASLWDSGLEKEHKHVKNL
ncbi:Clavaminate synthase-like protein [Cylindrobasidium torrendii FP15055 ss-10]|uniref:Clavaminate synthase-like protein n=1 Tax=Cylindrobasidium torrendii FP15055 ss-10 TaxID=1314674 RepID=A0A0D7BAU0_9AGAR|nr:Clavaminate synthase-like protein [Cylindrobasidium torrendii FP15055 ss-10]